MVIDDVTEALARAKASGVKNLLVQPTHLMNGYEYGDLVKELEACAGDFETVKIGAPLLTTDEDFAVVAQAMVDAAAGHDDGKTAVCYMGHGTEAGFFTPLALARARASVTSSMTTPSRRWMCSMMMLEVKPRRTA